MSKWDEETAEWYAQKYGEYATNRLGVEALEWAEDAAVVDVGCGTGAALREASKYVTRGHLIGVDPIPRMLEIARQRLEDHPGASRIEFRQGPAHQLPVDDHSADVVLAFDSYDHWGSEHQAAGLLEVARILREGGRFVLVKDGGLGHDGQAKAALQEALDEAGFAVQHERQLEEGEVSLTLWICAAQGR